MVQLKISFLSIAMLLLSLHLSAARYLAEKQKMKTALDEARIILRDALRRRPTYDAYRDPLARGQTKPSVDELDNLLDAAVKEIQDEYDIRTGLVEDNGPQTDQTPAKQHLLPPARSGPHSRRNRKKAPSGTRKLKMLTPTSRIGSDNMNGEGWFSSDQLQVPSSDLYARLPYQGQMEQQSDGTPVGQSDGPYTSKLLKAIKDLFHHSDETDVSAGMRGQKVRPIAFGSKKSRVGPENEEGYDGWSFASLHPYFNDYQALQQVARKGTSGSNRNHALPHDEMEYAEYSDGQRRLEDPPYGWFQKGDASQAKDDLESTRLADELENLAAALEDEISSKHAKTSGLERPEDGKHAHLLSKKPTQKGLVNTAKTGKGHGSKTKGAARLRPVSSNEKFAHPTSMQATDIERNDLHMKPEIESKTESPARFEGRPMPQEHASSSSKEASGSEDRNRESRMIDELEARVAELQQEIAAKERHGRSLDAKKRLRM